LGQPLLALTHGSRFLCARGGTSAGLWCCWDVGSQGVEISHNILIWLIVGPYKDFSVLNSEVDFAMLNYALSPDLKGNI